MNLNTLKNIANDEIKKHLGPDWRFIWLRAKRRLGVCNFTDKTIGISKPLAQVNEESRMRNTLMHEIEHGICGFEVMHGSAWKKKFKELGGSGLRQACPEKDGLPFNYCD